MTFFGVKNLEILELSANLFDNLEGFKFNIFQPYVNRISFSTKETVSFLKIVLGLNPSKQHKLINNMLLYHTIRTELIEL